MAHTLLTIIATALLSSLLTLGIAHYIFQKRVKSRYEQGVQDAIDKFKEEVGPEIEARVKRGVMEGFKSALAGNSAGYHPNHRQNRARHHG